MIWTLLLSYATATTPLTPSTLLSNSAVVRDWMVGGGDLNGDGYDDVWLPGSASVDLRLGGPTGVSTAVAFSVTPRPYPVGVGDINGDRVDDVVLSSNGTTWDIYRGVTNGLPALWATIPAAATSVQVGDLDGDGYADMLFPTTTGYTLWRGGALAPVGPVANVDLGASLGETSWRFAVGGDADGDVRGDLLVTHATCAGVLRTDLWWHRGLPLGPARTPSWRWSTAHNDCFGWNPNETGVEPARVTWIGDTNGDGFDDVGRDRGGLSASLLGGPGGFEDPVELPAGQLTQRGPAQRLVGIGDFNGDGFDDVARRQPDGLQVLLGSSHGLVPNPVFIWSQAFALVSWDVARLGDVNADGLADFGIWDNAHNYEVWVVLGVPLRDIDGDGYPTPADCDDGQIATHPGAAESGTGEDLNCDGLIQCADDLDGDGWGRNNGAVIPVGQSCGPGSTPRRGDCDDNNPAVWPGAADPPGDLVDGDCDGRLSCSLDVDGDGFGSAAGVEISGGNCSADARYVPNAADCDDNDLHVRPGAAEVGGNDVDEDCDGQLACAVDDDGDGWGDPTHFVMAPACAWPADDCDDTDPASFPAAPEVTGDAADQNCDGQYACWLDADFDGWGDATSVVQRPTTCGTLDGSPYSTDCDDEDPSIHPTAFEAPGLDSDCDGSALCGQDLDGDGFGDPNHRAWTSNLPCRDERDCDDHDPAVHPNAGTIIADGIDQNCDGVDECYLDADGDGYGFQRLAPGGCDAPDATPLTGDIYDNHPEYNPGTVEIPGNDNDEDCDSYIDCFLDQDRDGWGSDTVVTIERFFGSCLDIPRGDCDDGDAAVFPGQPDSRGNGVDESCDGQDGLGMALFRQPEADWVMVGGAHARGRIYVALSTTGLGAGPCPPALHGQCLGLRAPRLLAVVTANADGAVWLDATTAAWRNPNGTTWLQAVEVGGSVVLTRPIAIPAP